MMCCDTSYCNNHREHTTAPPTEPTEPVTAAITMATTTGREDSTSGKCVCVCECAFMDAW